MSGLIHIYCGNGKGKTTCATGLCIRAVGAGNKVLICRFLKNEHSSELNVLRTIEGITVLPSPPNFGFTSNMTEETKKQAKQANTKLAKDAIDLAMSGDYQILFMDEIMAGINYEMVDKEVILDFLKNKPDKLEVILTGRDPADELIELADYVSEIQKIKHPYDRNIKARKGIEF